MKQSTKLANGIAQGHLGPEKQLEPELGYNGAAMPDGAPKDVTALLLDWNKGNRQALDEMLPLVYDELRRVAARYLQRERPGNTLQGTALVHEAYLRLIDQNRVKWQNRAHFLGVAAQMIRRILVDHARSKLADKRGGRGVKLSLDESIEVPRVRGLDLVALDEALQDLGQIDPPRARIVELRFFAGLSIEETAEAVGMSPATVKRNWVTARAWLFRAISSRKETASGSDERGKGALPDT